MEAWLWTLLCAAIGTLLWRHVIREQWYRPRRLAAALSAQGISGPRPSLMLGNLKEVMRSRREAEAKDMDIGCHDIEGHVHPHFARWSRSYGVPFTYWWANEPRVFVKDLEMIREVLYSKSLGRSPKEQRLLGDIFGRGLVATNGEEWAVSRQILSPAFHAEKIKRMTGTMVFCVEEMLKNWQEPPFEIDAEQQFTVLASDIISRTAFGSSYEEGQRVFKLLSDLFPLVLKKFATVWSPSLAKQINKIKDEIRTRLETVIEMRRALREESGNTLDYGDDLLGIMLREVEQNQASKVFTRQKIVDECKTFYLAGQETTATLLTWTVMLLAENPVWQERARAEVQELCGERSPDAEAASKMRIVGMVLNESLRLYPPAVFVIRHSTKSMKLGSLVVPAGAGIHVPVLELLHDQQVWGADVHEFRPDRFADGVAKACKNAFAFMPFAHGPRVCIGQSFALMEAKVALAMLLQRFRLEPSPKYRHCPVQTLTLRPKHGMPISIRRL